MHNLCNFSVKVGRPRAHGQSPREDAIATMVDTSYGRGATPNVGPGPNSRRCDPGPPERAGLKVEFSSFDVMPLRICTFSRYREL